MFYGIKTKEDSDLFENALASINRVFKRVFAYDNLITLDRSCAFVHDTAFMDAFNKNCTTAQEKTLIWRLHILCWAARHCLSIEGDFVECGVLSGFCTSVITSYLQFDKVDKRFFLYDTFSGIPEEFNVLNRTNKTFNDKDYYAIVCEKFKDYPNITVTKGVVPYSFAEVVPEKIAFMHIDMNSATAELAALTHLFDRLTPGGMIVFDDYGWASYGEQLASNDAFMEKNNHKIVELPTGQGLVIKKHH